MLDIPDELLRKIVREAMLELGPEPDPGLLRKVVKEVIRRLAPLRQERASSQPDLPPHPTHSQH